MTSEQTLTQQIINLVEQRIGLNLEMQLQAGTANLLQRLAENDLQLYLQNLRASDETSAIWQNLIHALTIGETYFLRDKQQFSILRETIVPQIVAQRRELDRLLLRVWSVGCATGEEAYSLAVMLRESVPDYANWQIDIIGTDINQRAITAARAGVYRAWSFRNAPASFQHTYFEQHDDNWHIHASVKETVTFQRRNILHGFLQQSCDLVLCRHVLMYLSEAKATEAETVLYEALAPGGWLLLGQAEMLKGQRDRWTMHVFPGTSLYQKPSKRFPKSSYRVHIVDKNDTTPIMTAATPSSSYQDAVNAIHEDDLDSAAHHLAELLTDHVRDPRAHTLMAYICANRKAYPEAQAHINMALQDDPLLADAHYIRAMIHIEHGETTDAMAALQAVLYSERKHPLAAFTLGNLHASLGDKKRAVNAWKLAEQALVENADQTYISAISDITVEALQRLLSNNIEANS